MNSFQWNNPSLKKSSGLLHLPSLNNSMLTGNNLATDTRKLHILEPKNIYHKKRTLCFTEIGTDLVPLKNKQSLSNYSYVANRFSQR